MHYRDIVYRPMSGDCSSLHTFKLIEPQKSKFFRLLLTASPRYDEVNVNYGSRQMSPAIA